MAEQSIPPVSSIKSRIAALNLEEVHAPAPGSQPAYSYEPVVVAKKTRPPPPPPQRPSPNSTVGLANVEPKSNTGPVAMRRAHTQPVGTVIDAPKAQPALPPRPSRNNPQPPSLPPRKTSGNPSGRRDSMESVSTVASGLSSLSVASAKTTGSGSSTVGGSQVYQIRAPAYDPAKLPPLPPKRTATEERKPVTRSAKSSPSVVTRAAPPLLPSRPALPARSPSTIPDCEQRNSSQTAPRKSALSFALNRATEAPPPIPPARPTDNSTPVNGVPPPIPLASRPNLAAIQASKPKVTTSCLICRDYSGPDGHAARFPRESIPSLDIAWLSHQLTSPFPSLTDKARVIFAWLHFNIDYDIENLFAGSIPNQSAENTLQSGRAVCAGYAAIFQALAEKAGLESRVVGGHGKGYGYSPVKPGQSIPPFEGNHAWNVFRMDNGQWKLIDCCWGAGHEGNRKYVRKFAPECFTMDNNEFGLRHFPEDGTSFYRTDGRTSISWEEYALNDYPERVQTCSDCSTHGINSNTFQPAFKQIKVHDPQDGTTVRFQFSAFCPHWDQEKQGRGKPQIMILKVGGRDGRAEDYLPFETDGHSWWLDVSRAELGCPGQQVSVVTVNTFGDKSGKGLTVAEFKQKKGRVGMSFAFIAMWELV